uniref:Uncharacterized protein n=1 Tax=Myotis myotis TaxID=51298 RepID=A0A7J7TTK8_MYOMY|nr:hypothetical protein mMyoMyo1_008917 [Myotis myotis]
MDNLKTFQIPLIVAFKECNIDWLPYRGLSRKPSLNQTSNLWVRGAMPTHGATPASPGFPCFCLLSSQPGLRACIAFVVKGSENPGHVLAFPFALFLPLRVTRGLEALPPGSSRLRLRREAGRSGLPSPRGSPPLGSSLSSAGGAQC